MTEYIKREELMEFPIRRNHYDRENGNKHFINGIETVLEYAENLPAADVAPVVHGRWIKDNDSFQTDDYYCCYYDSAIVVAKDEESARHIHPGSTPGNPVVGYNAETYHYDKAWYESDDLSPYLDWTKPEYVKAKFIGTTDLYPEGTVLCASYNAG